MSTKAARRLRRKPPLNHAKLFKAAMEEVQIEDVLAKANRPRCRACSEPAKGMAILMGQLNGEKTMVATPLCQSCFDRAGDIDFARRVVQRVFEADGIIIIDRRREA